MTRNLTRLEATDDPLNEDAAYIVVPNLSPSPLADKLRAPTKHFLARLATLSKSTLPKFYHSLGNFIRW